MNACTCNWWSYIMHTYPQNYTHPLAHSIFNTICCKGDLWKRDKWFHRDRNIHTDEWLHALYRHYDPVWLNQNWKRFHESVCLFRPHLPKPISTLGNPFAFPGINIRAPSVIYVENVHFDWFNLYLFTGEHFQSDLNIFQLDFMIYACETTRPASAALL